MINSNGFRNNHDYDYKKTVDTLRILSIGDSHTLGYEVSQEETFSSQMEMMLAKDSIPNIVLNAGVSGFGTAEELVYLENEGIKYKPDFVILGFCRNDFDDNLKSDLFGLVGDSLHIHNREYIPGVNIQDFIYRFSVVKWLSENSYLYSYTFNAVWNFFKNALRDKTHSDTKEYAISINQNINDYQKTLSFKLLSAIYHICKKNNISLIVIDLPSWELNNQIISSMDEVLMTNPRTPLYDYFINYKEIKESVKANEIVHMRGHHHISNMTHRFIAERCAKYIKSKMKDK
jgi:hypothetical protein